MIEVEKKFILSNKNKDSLIKIAQFIKESIFTDIYFDDDNYSLTTKDKWLRRRDGRFELKLPLNNSAVRDADQYEELEDEQKIIQALNLPTQGDLADNLAKAGYLPFCTCKTIRQKYKKDLFNIDLDTANIENFIYYIGEIELMIKDKSEINSATEKIMDFAKNNGLSIGKVHGKVIQYLKTEKPDHYRALVLAGAIEDF